MQRMFRALAVGGLLAGAALALLPLGGQAQGGAAKSEKVRFSSVDGVELHGTFYANAKKPTVLIVHAIGDSSRAKEYADLAAALQDKGYAVLTFDLRAHGQSKSVDPTEFWSNKNLNLKFVAGGTSRKDTIELRDFSKQYYSVFVNDIAAAKVFLDKRNDANECNSSNLIVIGADSGATLGAIWMNSEWSRFKLIPPATGFGQPQPDLKNPEGRNAICGFWLSITPDLGARKINLASLLYLPAKEKKVPMVFVYNSDDANDKSTAIRLVKTIKGKDKKNYELTASSEVNAGPKLSGRVLLKQIKPEDIVSYLQKVVDEKGNDWQEQEFRKSYYMWQIGRRPIIPPAKGAGDTTIRFSLYNEFIPGP